MGTLFPFTIICIKITPSVDPPAPASDSRCVQLSGEFFNGLSGNFTFICLVLFVATNKFLIKVLSTVDIVFPDVV